MEATAEIPREKLRQIVEKNGETVLEDHDRVEGLLRDHCGAHRKEISALVGALQERVPLELRSSWQTAMTPEAMRARLVQRLEDNRGLAPEVADWAVEAWSYALGIGLGRRSDRLDSVVIGHNVAGSGVGGSSVESFGLRASSDRVQSSLERNGYNSDRVGGLAVAGEAAALTSAEQKKKAGIGVGILVAVLAVSALGYHHKVASTPVPAPIPAPAPAPQPVAKVDPPTPAPVPEPTHPTASAISSGTSVDVRLDQGINSDEVQVGQTFTGTVATPVMIHGAVAVPQGGAALVRVVGIDKAGKLTGHAAVQLELAQVSVGGRHYAVSSAAKQIQGPAQVAEAGKRAGVGAAVGAVGGFVVGHLLHHGAAGAGAGAVAGGATGVVTTKPHPATLKAESIVKFKLTKQLAIK